MPAGSEWEPNPIWLRGSNPPEAPAVPPAHTSKAWQLSVAERGLMSSTLPSVQYTTLCKGQWHTDNFGKVDVLDRKGLKGSQATKQTKATDNYATAKRAQHRRFLFSDSRREAHMSEICTLQKEKSVVHVFKTSLDHLTYWQGGEQFFKGAC